MRRVMASSVPAYFNFAASPERTTWRTSDATGTPTHWTPLRWWLHDHDEALSQVAHSRRWLRIHRPQHAETLGVQAGVLSDTGHQVV
jgi:hypothetical protein